MTDDNSYIEELLLEDARRALEEKDWVTAVVLWQRVLAITQSRQRAVTAYVKQINACHELGKAAEVTRLMDEAIARYPKSVLLRCSRARIFARRANWQDALLELEMARNLKNRLPSWAFRLLIECYARTGDAERQLEATEAACADHPEDMGLRYLFESAKKLEGALELLRGALGEVSGRACVVFGSAPHPDFGEDGFSGEPIICCNGSARSLADRFGLSPSCSLIHSHVFLRDTDSDREVREALSGLPDPGKSIILTTHQREIEASDAEHFDWAHRFHVCTRVLGISVPFLDFSTGAFAVLAAIFAGATSVRLVGFSFTSKGHSYNDKSRYRNHVSSDAALYSLLAARGYRISATAPEILAICRNRLD